MSGIVLRWDVTGKQRIELVPFMLPEEAPDDHVVVEFVASGLCGSDTHMYNTGALHAGHDGAQRPLTLGHELIGRVKAIGKDVTALAVQDFVAIEPGIPCGTCNQCRKGRYHCCPRTAYMATPPTNGGLADEFVWPARWCHRLSPTLAADPVLASLVEPLAACRQAWALRERIVERADDEWTAVTGSGSMAFGVVAIIKALNPNEKVVVIARNAKALEFATTLGADATVQLSNDDPKSAFLAASAIAGGWISSLFECTGDERVLESIIEARFMLADGAIIGLGCHYGVSFDVACLRRLELAFQPVRRSCGQFPATLALLESHHAGLFRQLVGGTVQFEDFGKFMKGVLQATPVGTGGPKTVVVSNPGRFRG